MNSLMFVFFARRIGKNGVFVVNGAGILVLTYGIPSRKVSSVDDDVTAVILYLNRSNQSSVLQFNDKIICLSVWTR